MSKAAEARKLLIEGMSVADVSRATGAHYSQVHGIMKKLKESNELTSDATKSRGQRAERPAAAPKAQQPSDARTSGRRARASAQAAGTRVDDVSDSAPAEWLVRPDDEDAGPCAECGVPLVERTVTYGGRDYGRALIHTFRSRGVEPTPQQLHDTERHTARRADARVKAEADAKLGKRAVTTAKVVKPMVQAPAKIVGPARRSPLKAKPR